MGLKLLAAGGEGWGGAEGARPVGRPRKAKEGARRDSCCFSVSPGCCARPAHSFLQKMALKIAEPTHFEFEDTA